MIIPEQKPSLNQEDYLAKEKQNILTFNLIISVLSIIGLLGEILCSFLLNSLYPDSIPLFLGLMSILGIISSFLTFIWSFYLRQKLSGAQEKWGENTDSGLARFLLMVSIFVFFGILSLTIVLHLWSSRGLDLFVAEYPQEDQASYISSWDVLAWITTAFSFVNLLLLIYIIYTCFICCGSPNTVRVVLYISCFFIIILGFTVLNFVKILFQYGENTQVSNFLDFTLYGILGCLVIIAILAAIVLFYINYRRERSEYLMLGTTLLIILLFSSGIGGTIYRESLDIHTAFNDDCRTYLSEISYDDISDYGCSPKYLEYGLEYLNCSDAEQVLVWESEIDGATNENKYSVGCLNMNCCSVIGDIYELNLLKLESFNIALLCAIFLTVSASFYLTNKYSGERTLRKSLEYVFILTLLILTILGIVTLFLFQVDLPEERTTVSVDSTEFIKSAEKINYTLSNQFLPSNSCSLIKNYNPSYNISDLESNSSTVGVRTIILVSNADLWYNDNYTFEYIQMFDKDLGSSLFSGGTVDGNDFLAFQGKHSKIGKFVSEEIYLCPHSEATSVYLEYFNTMVNLTSNVVSDSSVKISSASNARSLLETTSQSTASKSHKKSHKTTGNLVNETANVNTSTFTDLQNELNSIQFGDLTITAYSVSLGTAIDNATVKIYAEVFESCAETAQSPFLQIYSNSSGIATAYNIPYGNYTVVATKSNMKSNCLQANISQETTSQSVFVVEDLEVNEIAVLLETSSSLDLNLFGAFQFATSDTCVVGYFNEECTGLSFKLLNLTGEKAQLVKITTLGEYYYLFFVKRELSWTEYQQKIESNTDLNDDFLGSEFSIKAYVHELQFPAASVTYSGQNTNQTLVNATHLAYLGYCVDGAQSDLLVSMSRFWMGNETFPRSNNVCTGSE